MTPRGIVHVQPVAGRAEAAIAAATLAIVDPASVFGMHEAVMKHQKTQAGKHRIGYGRHRVAQLARQHPDCPGNWRQNQAGHEPARKAMHARILR